MTLWKDEDDYKILTDKNEIQELTTNFIFLQSNKRLLDILHNYFSERKGFSTEFLGFMFKNELEEFDQSYENMTDNQVLLSADYPAAVEDCEAYLNFDEFYQYFEDGFNKLVNEFPDRYNELEVRQALEKVKEALRV